jgi:hypothetical protein
MAGRKPRAIKLKPVIVRFEPDRLERVDAIAARDAQSRLSLIAELIDLGLQQKETHHEAPA